MIDRKFFLRNLWRWKCGVAEESPHIDLDELRRTEWSFRFEELMRNRLVFGALRYGRLHASCKPPYDRVKASIQRLIHYDKTGNLEMLVDVANLCLLEFEEGRHPTRHFEEAGDNFQKVQVKDG